MGACAGGVAAGDSSSQPRPLAMTCWRLAGRGIEKDGFWSGAVRLDTAISRALPDPSGREIIPLAPVDAFDTTLMANIWAVAGDSVRLVRTNALSGVELAVRIRGDRMEGTSSWFMDVAPFRQDPPDRVTGVRVQCPPRKENP